MTCQGIPLLWTITQKHKITNDPKKASKVENPEILLKRAQYDAKEVLARSWKSIKNDIKMEAVYIEASESEEQLKCHQPNLC